MVTCQSSVFVSSVRFLTMLWFNFISGSKPCVCFILVKGHLIIKLHVSFVFIWRDSEKCFC
jgi:hypothetical protein